MSVKLFVSSRFEEFRELREEIAARFAEQDGFIETILLDDGQAAPVDPITRSLAAVEASDFVLLLLGRTYSENAETDRSVVHKEFERAMELERTVFAYTTVASADEPVDTRVEELLEEVREGIKGGDKGGVTVGILTRDVAVDATGIVEQIGRELWVPGQVDGQRVERLADVLIREMEYLGVRDGQSAVVLEHEAGTRLRYAFNALDQGDMPHARQQLESLQTDWKYDWTTNYVHARLLEMSGTKLNLKMALTISGRALSADPLEDAPLAGLAKDEAEQRRQIATKVLRARLLRRTDSGPDEARELVDQALRIHAVNRQALIERLLQGAWFRDEELARAAMRMLLQTYPDVAIRLLHSRDAAPVREAVHAEASDYLLRRLRRARRQLILLDVPAQDRDRSPGQLVESFRALASEHASAVDRMMEYADDFMVALGGGHVTTSAAHEHLAEMAMVSTQASEHFDRARDDAAQAAREFYRVEDDPTRHVSGVRLAYRQLRARALGADPKLVRHLRRPAKDCVAAARSARQAEEHLRQAQAAFCEAAEPMRQRAVGAGVPIEDLSVEQILAEGVGLVRDRLTGQVWLHSKVFSSAPAVGQKAYVPIERAKDGDLTRIEEADQPAWLRPGEEVGRKLLVRRVRGGYSAWAALHEGPVEECHARERAMLTREVPQHFGQDAWADDSLAALSEGKKPAVLLAKSLGRSCKPSVRLLVALVGALATLLVLLPLVAMSVTPHRALQFPGSAAEAQGWERDFFDTTLLSDSVVIEDVVSAGSVSLAVGSDGDSYRAVPHLWISEEWGRWERLPDVEARFGTGGDSWTVMTSVAAAGPGFVAVGADEHAAAVWTSGDGRTWDRVVPDPDVFGHDGDWTEMRSVAAGGPGLVAVGDESVDAGRGPVVWVSEDGSAWQRVPMDVPAFDGWDSLSIDHVSPVGQGLVAVGRDDGTSAPAVWTSVDGLEWQRSPDTSDNRAALGGGIIRSVTAGGPGLVAVGSWRGRGAVWTSTDGSNWGRVPHEPGLFGAMGSELIDVTATASGLVAVGNESATMWSRERMHGHVWTSPDGRSWKRIVDEDHVFARPLLTSGFSAVHADERGVVAVGTFEWFAAVWSYEAVVNPDQIGAARAREPDVPSGERPCGPCRPSTRPTERSDAPDWSEALGSRGTS